MQSTKISSNHNYQYTNKVNNVSSILATNNTNHFTKTQIKNKLKAINTSLQGAIHG